MSFVASTTPLQTIEFDRHVILQIYLLVNPSCNFQTSSKFIKFESQPKSQSPLISSVWRATAIPSPVNSGITSVLLFHFFSKDSPVTRFQVTFVPMDPKSVELMKINQDTSQGQIKLDINELSSQKHFYQTFKFLSKKEGNPKIRILWEYMCEQKTFASNDYLFNLNVSPPFHSQLKVAKVRNEGVLLEASLGNMSKYIARDVRLEVIPSSSYVVDESELSIADALLPSSYVSGVYGLELQRGEGTTSSNILESLSVKWSTGFEENCQMLLDTRTLNRQTTTQKATQKSNQAVSPRETTPQNSSQAMSQNASSGSQNIIPKTSQNNLQTQKELQKETQKDLQNPVAVSMVGSIIAISMIGSPQVQKLLTPFAVKFDIHNTTAEERIFTINVDTEKDSGLLPFGIHVFTTELLPAKGSQRIVMEFIALKQGLLPYPELIISTADYDDFRIDPENGVLILADDTIPQ
ncbi:hypothetical protein TRFO_41841 [Tritrichomonas foetus]|uniref:Uncharacterized protein n=1 Tax=Tritrichomonas foetus TaxID=1144522 RepID=A0A1J4KZQ1_9EUKA|nr:hypothetical protein TRFO_41841 [Tritrichomonas foetus]|eukprot:OHT16344.1 hypothetical protein TRFO_41841 [Tritrichomonas foetus]